MRRSPKNTPRGAVPRKEAAPKVPLRERLASYPWQEWRQTLVLRWRHGLALAVLGLVIMVLISIPSWLDKAPLKRVAVEGVTDQRRADEVREEVSEFVQGKNYFNLQLPEMHDRLEKLGWVETVAIRRQWPNTLKFIVKERKPTLVWNGEWLIGEDGKRFRGVDKYSVSALPFLSGPDERLEEVLDYYEDMSDLVAPANLTIKKMAVDARLTAQLEMQNEMKLVVDRAHYSGKLDRFIDMYQRRFSKEDKAVESVDLRYADGMAVKWSDKPAANNKRGS